MPASRLELSTGARDFRRGLFTRPLFCDGAKTHARTMASSIKGEPHYITARSDSSIIKHTPEAFNREELSLRFPPYSHQGGPCATGGGAAVVAHGRQGRIKCGQQRGNGTSAPSPRAAAALRAQFVAFCRHSLLVLPIGLFPLPQVVFHLFLLFLMRIFVYNTSNIFLTCAWKL